MKNFGYIGEIVDYLRDEVEKANSRPWKEHVAIVGSIAVLGAGAFYVVHENKVDDYIPAPTSDVSHTSSNH
jgi:hypothetical protein